MIMKYAIVTGASKGLGKGIAKRLIEEKVNVIAVSRSENEELQALAARVGVDYRFYRCNLASSTEISSVFQEICKIVFHTQTDAIYLINNAGVIEPIESVGNLNEEAFLANVQINLMAPVLICNHILSQAKKSTIPLIIANITSGAGERPIHGWSIYCSTKSAINMFTHTAGLELENQQSHHKIIAFSPGIMDTEMQQTIRSSTEDAFRELHTFKDYKEKGMLRSPVIVANALVKLVLDGQVENGKIYYVNDLL